MASTSGRLLGLLRNLAGALHKTTRATARPPAGPRPSNTPGPAPLASPYPGDFTGSATVAYAPRPDGDPDPGEIVWTWVPYEEDYLRGNDRPVLVVGRNGARLLAVMLTSKDHGNKRRDGFDYIDLGPGAWDARGRPSEAKLDRILQVSEADIRREGAVLDAARFALVADGLRRRHGWK
ncbi:type II toxin-antitoxin system PemK/MazF family toxin [Specibacter sp. RAF43]|uniref:type II toxin-antitoxin system PemK/MazF family toxin n=1 Tax=Specibacter sp. RAF43 TaxID=3233057 RepID=UPI003F9EB9D3